ncbi:hypothetical protein EV284_3546 [Streptomyces sp. BK022]|nr:hypothetical protein EV284_3546 [Streptomyces sp. BK022]
MPSSPENTAEEKEAARRVVAGKTDDMEEEYEVLCALGLL